MLDYLRIKDKIIIDLKTTQDASSKFIYSVKKFNYHKQAAFYLDATGCEEFYIVAVEKSRPYGINIFKMSEQTINEGRALYREQLNLYANCEENNFWPSYGHKFIEGYIEEKQITMIEL